jgi:signal transduction histidine kinase
MSLNRIVIKLGGTIALLFLLVLLPLGFVIDQIFTGFYYGKIQDDIDRMAARYAEAIAASPGPMSVNMIEMMSSFSEVKMYVIDDAGNIVANAGVGWRPRGTTVSKEEVAELATGKSVQKVVEDGSGHNRYLVTGRPIIAGGTFHGAVYVLSSIEAIDQSLKKVRELLILSGIGAFFLAVGFTFVLSRKLSDPLVFMERATRRIAKGELDTRVNIPSNDEVGSLAKAINDLARDLQRYRDTRSEFFANISHELRTPVTYLEGYAKIVKDGLYENEEQKQQYLNIIYEESGRLTHLIQDLFELSKMEEGKFNLSLEWIDLSEVLENISERVRYKALQKRLDLKMDVQRQLPIVYADGLRMEQIFLNLLDNAIRYTDHGSITVRMYKKADNVVIVIEDTGKGIPAEDLPYIFERFYRVEKSRSREHGGTGLGLAIVKMLVELQGGSIQAHSEQGQGTRFELVFKTASGTGGESH